MLARTILLLSMPALVACSWNGSTSSSSTYSSTMSSPREGGGIIYRETVARGSLAREMDVDGQFELSDDDRDIVAMTPGSRLSIEEKSPTRRRVSITAPNGVPIVEYWIDDEKRELDTAGEQWLREIVAELVEAVGLGATVRAERILADGGPAALVGATETVSGALRRVYLSRIVEIEDLDNALLIRVVGLGGEIISDGKKRELAMRAMPVETANADLTTEILELIGKVVSSTGQSELLRSLLDTRPLNDVQAQHFLRLARAIVSDSGKRDVLTAAITKLPSKHRLELIEAFGTVISSTSQGALYETYISTVALDEESAILIAKRARGVISSSTQGAIVVKLIEHAPPSNGVDAEILQTADGIISSGSKEQVIGAFLEKRTLTAESDAQVAKVIDNVLSKSSEDRLREKLEAARQR